MDISNFYNVFFSAVKDTQPFNHNYTDKTIPVYVLYE
jgi:hypothetical protein